MSYALLDPETLDAYLASHPDAVLLDVRGQDEWEAGHHPKAILMPHWFVAMKIRDVVSSKDQPIVAYCRSGARSSLAADALDRLGYTQVSSVSGGYEAYVNSHV
jgi:rhodanese-related sulfurtransferase